jgi:hypothetical protein
VNRPYRDNASGWGAVGIALPQPGWWARGRPQGSPLQNGKDNLIQGHGSRSVLKFFAKLSFKKAGKKLSRQLAGQFFHAIGPVLKHRMG